MKKLNHFQKRNQNRTNSDFDIFSSHEQLFVSPKVTQEKNYLAVFFTFVLLLGGLVAVISQIYKPKDINPYSLVAVRAVNVSGNSVGGAKVFINDKELGLTDSFGEWRKYMRLDESDTHKVRIEKILAGRKYSAKKSFAVKFKHDSAAEVALSLELKSKTFAPRATKSKVLLSQRRPTIEIPQDEVTISIKPQIKKSKSLLERHQRSVLVDKIVPALVVDLEKKGVKNVKGAKWKMEFSYVPKAGDVGYIKADIRWVDQRGKTHRTSLIREFSRTINDTARNLSGLIRTHVSKGYWGVLENGHWRLELENVPEYWRFTRETVLVDEMGKAFPALVRTDKQNDMKIEMMTGGFAPCRLREDGSRCYFTSKSIENQSPRPGWESHSLKGFGRLPKDAQIFVAGYKAFPMGNNEWQYWAPRGGLVKVNVLSNGKIWQSYSFRSKREVKNSISFRGRSLSRR